MLKLCSLTKCCQDIKLIEDPAKNFPLFMRDGNIHKDLVVK